MVEPVAAVPPKEMPPELLTEFLMDNHAHLIWLHMDDRGPVGQPRNWTTALLDLFLKRAKSEDPFIDVCGYRDVPYVYQALQEFPVTGLTGMVVGSIWPWVEAISLAAGELSFCQLFAYLFCYVLQTVYMLYCCVLQPSNTWDSAGLQEQGRCTPWSITL